MSDYVIGAAKRSAVKRIRPDAAQERLIETIITYSVFHHPFFAHLVMAELPIVLTHDVPIAATDQYCIMINPDRFFKYTLQEQAFAIYHEVMHCVFNHPAMMQSWHRQGKVTLGTRDLEYHHEYMNMAMDYVINAQLIHGQCGKFSQDWLYDSDYSAKGEESVIDVYERLLIDKPPVEGPRDILLPPGDGQDDPAKQKPRDQDVWNAQVAAAAEAARAQGKLPAGFERLIGDILDPKVAWRDHLRATVMRAADGAEMNWALPDRRMISRGVIGHDPVFFGRSSDFGCGLIVIAVDTSGSIGETELALFMGEMHGIINDLNPSQVAIMWCDAKVHRTDYIEEASELEEVRAKGAPGGGGTSFRPVFKEIEELDLSPDMLVYLTDMAGSFPNIEPAYPTIWASTFGTEAPFGEVVMIDD